MTAGSIAATALALTWPRVDGLAAVYALWIGLGLAMATVLYEPAFTVVAKWFADAAERRRALTALTLVAALASFIFLPLSQALIDVHGWRDALVILALILGGVTIRSTRSYCVPRGAGASPLARGCARHEEGSSRAGVCGAASRPACAAACGSCPAKIRLWAAFLTRMVVRSFCLSGSGRGRSLVTILNSSATSMRCW